MASQVPGVVADAASNVLPSTRRAFDLTGLTPTLERHPKLHLATRHLSILTSLFLIAMAAAVVAGTILEAGSFAADAQVIAAAFLGSVALSAALLNRMVAVGFTGFRYKDYDPVTFLHQLVLAVRGALVALVLLILLRWYDGQGSVTLVLAATAFALGYFGDLSFEKLRDMTRLLLGRPIDSDKPAVPLIGGVDVPLEAFRLEKEVVGRFVDDVEPVLDGLKANGLEYTHELVAALSTRSGRERLANRVKAAPSSLERLGILADLTRSGAPIAQAVALARKGVLSASAVAHAPDEVLTEANAEQRALVGSPEAGDPIHQVSPTQLKRSARGLLESP